VTTEKSVICLFLHARAEIGKSRRLWCPFHRSRWVGHQLRHQVPAPRPLQLSLATKTGTSRGDVIITSAHKGDRWSCWRFLPPDKC